MEFLAPGSDSQKIPEICDPDPVGFWTFLPLVVAHGFRRKASSLGLVWVAVKEPKLSCHNGCIYSK